ncbi:MAG: hypothetical protein OQJ96_06590 [Flavobacteriales bacterium]|nr:hypothetical protein [Flavobacteriales bacterium]MCW8913744.1 hypothetical protein [Flavobacteriales bacterium]MCW8938474.1 hypothetical protein [Flavobacteriales bacterium]MCW8967767.1 hypothetical protein [Flavobacteriales bacterium]MCW8989950.1 hypothetical protein [Flavobacteriales bacterium]
MDFDFTKGSFRDTIRNKQAQILLRTKDGTIQETDNFKKLHRLLISYKSENVITDFTAVLIEKSDIEELSDTIKENLFTSLSSHEGMVNNHLQFDKELKIINAERIKISDDNTEARKFFLELSKSNMCVFLISPEKVNYFVDGEESGAIFVSPQALKSYNELKDISKIFEVFNEYRKHLTQRDVYAKFFVPNSGLRAMKACLESGLKDKDKTEEREFLKQYSHLLNNKPEDRFREDLRMFLKQKLKSNMLAKEHVLENFKRLDIFINDDWGELYLIEVKWVGLSIHSTGAKPCTEYKASDINPAAVVQSVNYIKELIETHQKIKIAYLAVFDARAEIMEDTVKLFDKANLTTDNEKYYSRFVKIPDFRVVNSHPSA